MASIRRQGDVYEIRECRTTERGPRQYTLARFRRVLTPEVLDEAESRARRPFDALRLVTRARARGIPVSSWRNDAAARRLLAELRAGCRVEPSLVGSLKQALALLEDAPVPEHLVDAADWVGRSEAARGKALRGLLRTASRVARSRPSIRTPPDAPFPRFRSDRSSA